MDKIFKGFAFDREEFLSFKKILFSKGLSVNEFLAYFIHKCIMRDNDIEKFYEEALEIKISETEEDIKNIKLDDVESMYDIIESKIKEKKNETPGK